MISRQGGGGSYNLLNTIAAVFELIFRHCGLDPQSHKSDLWNKPKAGLLACIVGAGTSRTRQDALAVRYSPRNDSLNIKSEQGLPKSQNDKNLVPYYPNVLTTRKSTAFTLAEVLITLGIIGVVAAMTLPTLVQNYTNHVVETRLSKFYSKFNEAIRLAEVKFGDRKYWYEDAGGIELDENGNPIESTSKTDIWFKKYLSSFLITKKQFTTRGEVTYYLNDGSAFKFSNETNVFSVREIIFYPGNPEKCKKLGDKMGICKFAFEYYPIDTNTPEWKYLTNKGLEPKKYAWDGRVSSLYNDGIRGCKNSGGELKGSYCTAIIQLNGWKIPKDYPYKVSY